jgi:hypothetical protein
MLKAQFFFLPGIVEITGKWPNNLRKKVPIFGMSKNLVSSCLQFALLFDLSVLSGEITIVEIQLFCKMRQKKTYLVFHNNHTAPTAAAGSPAPGWAGAQEAKNWVNVSLQENFHRGVSIGVRNVFDAL